MTEKELTSIIQAIKNGHVNGYFEGYMAGYDTAFANKNPDVIQAEFDAEETAELYINELNNNIFLDIIKGRKN